jgi:hypothetical protein
MLLCLLAVCAKARASARRFRLKAVSAFDLAQGQPAFGVGMRCQCSEAADPNVKVYPRFSSEKPLYGSVTLGGDAYQPNSGTRFCFALDESGGTGQGYDRFYFDENGDLDLTNDHVRRRLKVPLEGATLDGWSITQQVCFEYVGIPLAFGSEGTRPLEVMPHLLLSETGEVGHLAFVTTTARRGRINVAGKKFNILLGHNDVISGWFDRPWTALHLIPGRGNGVHWWGGDRLMAMHKIESTFYRFSATPAGDKLMVHAYEGPLGTFEVGLGGRNLATMAVQGSLLSEDTAVPVGDVLSSGLQDPVQSSRLPEGDYLPYLLRLDYGNLHIEISNNYHADGHPLAAISRTPVFGIQIRHDTPLVFDFSNTPKVLFALPACDSRIKPGEELTVKAVLIDPVLDFMIRGLDLKSETGESVSLDPKVVIARADGTPVAEGFMPFG